MLLSIPFILGFSFDVFQSSHPPIGSTYIGTTRVAFIGKQDVELGIISKSHAKLRLNGIITLNDDIYYEFHNGAFTFQFSEKLANVLNKCFCTIQNARYTNDVASVEIYINVLRLRRRVFLHRKAAVQPHYF